MPKELQLNQAHCTRVGLFNRSNTGREHRTVVVDHQSRPCLDNVTDVQRRGSERKRGPRPPATSGWAAPEKAPNRSRLVSSDSNEFSLLSGHFPNSV
ncbi:MAG: hypothetical protein QOI66_1476 [Myxococcales bacterium]|nr:hypothetical protein [Myxococcales bacterium]